MTWKPNVTVAAIIEREGQFLMVEEDTAQGLRLNQPAGHLEEFESLLEASVRETLEETAHHFSPDALVGVYQWVSPDNGLTYLRFAFTGQASGPVAGRSLDVGIVRALWMSRDDIASSSAQHRSPLVARCVEDYCAGRRYPLNLIETFC
ncbi:MAG: hypothetical protein RIR70_950 [Pseudomonadota bacterium]|jgi:8-oxo-dGTP pyrophosphatase MutT (NUDIX family)